MESLSEEHKEACVNSLHKYEKGRREEIILTILHLEKYNLIFVLNGEAKKGERAKIK